MIALYLISLKKQVGTNVVRFMHLRLEQSDNNNLFISNGNELKRNIK
jgi:hypothetical protein